MHSCTAWPSAPVIVRGPQRETSRPLNLASRVSRRLVFHWASTRACASRPPPETAPGAREGVTAAGDRVSPDWPGQVRRSLDPAILQRAATRSSHPTKPGRLSLPSLPPSLPRSLGRRARQKMSATVATPTSVDVRASPSPCLPARRLEPPAHPLITLLVPSHHWRWPDVRPLSTRLSTPHTYLTRRTPRSGLGSAKRLHQLVSSPSLPTVQPPSSR